MAGPFQPPSIGIEHGQARAVARCKARHTCGGKRIADLQDPAPAATRLGAEDEIQALA